ncbi:hypothetical protein POM88_009132 [Heracleum sosnowskyi]|uniref:Uncharacterized protein n=1 Tax=Heracleum sosnowskyi TaxID=360622 RepID=A0AAD8J9C7_9APIA|nr:hypothetical protein POM88_009132 [Heracleum sosnowskyi]
MFSVTFKVPYIIRKGHLTSLMENGASAAQWMMVNVNAREIVQPYSLSTPTVNWRCSNNPEAVRPTRHETTRKESRNFKKTGNMAETTTTDSTQLATPVVVLDSDSMEGTGGEKEETGANGNSAVQEDGNRVANTDVEEVENNDAVNTNVSPNHDTAQFVENLFSTDLVPYKIGEFLGCDVVMDEDSILQEIHNTNEDNLDEFDSIPNQQNVATKKGEISVVLENSFDALVREGEEVELSQMATSSSRKRKGKIVGLSNSLWAKWVNCTVLKRSHFWTMSTPTDCSWILKKVLHLRPLARRFISIVIGNGLGTSLWFDPWWNNTTLASKNTDPIISQSSSTKNATVNSIILTGGWVLPRPNLRIHHICPTLQTWVSEFIPPVFALEKRDIILWNGIPLNNLKTSHIWDATRYKLPEVHWHDYI